MLTVGSFFAGIGGIELGLERTGGFETKWQVEIDDYANRVLAKHWPDAIRWRDVRMFPPAPESPWLGHRWRERWGVDLICGGFPCQDISVAGKGAGLAGARSGLWYEYARIVRVLRPRYVLVENVAALLTRGLDAVLGTLASLGYDAEWHCIPAGAFGAHFRGDRLFVVASSSPASCVRREGKWENPSRAFERNEFARLVERELQVCVPAGKSNRVSDGVPCRVDRLRCLGNAVVPQVAQWTGERILEAEQI